MTTYDESSIETVEGLSYIRLRPTGFIPSNGVEGQFHIIEEGVANSIDELEEIAKLYPGRITVVMMRDEVRNTYQIIIKDNGRGVPIDAMVRAYTVRGTSGKFNTDSYKFSAGLFGIGIKATVALAKLFRGITHRIDGIASLYVKDGIENDVLDRAVNADASHGATIVFEPDSEIFTDIELFSHQAYEDLVLRLKKLCFSNTLNIEFKIVSHGIDPKFWTMPVLDADKYLESVISHAELFFTSEGFDTNKFLHEYWKLQRPFAWSAKIVHPIVSKEQILGFDVRLFYAKFERYGNRFGMVNNVAIDHAESHHLITVHDVIKHIMSAKIETKEIREFFNNNYRMPIFIAANVKYSGAEFAGTTKHAFRDKEFAKLYKDTLTPYLTNGIVDELLTELWTDIETQYNNYITGGYKPQNTNRIFERLNYHEKFVDCEEHGPDSELFLSEGDGASGKTGRNKKLQAMYALRGVPFNGITAHDKFRENSLAIQKHKIYADIITILGINPHKFDVNTLNFGKINVMADGDGVSTACGRA